MPVFQSDLERRESAEQLSTSAMASPQDRLDCHNGLRRKPSEESIRTEFCDGPIPESPMSITPERNDSTECSDRSEFIERLKRGESPTWMPNRHFGSLQDQHPVSPIRSSKQSDTDSSTLLPAATITPEKGGIDSDNKRRRQEGLGIERPHSALHSGDFTQDEISHDAGPIQNGHHAPKRQDFGGVSDPWLAASPPRDFRPFSNGRRDISSRSEETSLGLPSLSSSISSSFIYRPPTSPLVQSESNDDLDLTSPIDGIDIGSSVQSPRRHTLMSSSYNGHHSSSLSHPPHLRHEKTFPYQAHQPRRPLVSTIGSFSPQTPASSRSRRLSNSSDMSLLQHASMVGSYEESIMRGRMSTNPSKPFDFLAQIGVLGLGKCKSSLRCPAHVTLPFPAVFYSYSSSSHSRSKGEDGPSPYVGQIDLENGLPNLEEDARSKRKMQSRAFERMATESARPESSNLVESSERDPRRVQRPKRRSNSPRAPPGGSYRIPEKGQVQIMIKNPNKTAVKLFLIPYDLTGMEPGTKTFIRQRCYSAGPIIDNLPKSRQDGNTDRPILRYLVHLHICCPSRGRYYLYKSIRVVFANRVPDGKEKVRNEITTPEPRFTSYKPIRAMHLSNIGGTGPGASLAADKAFRRRSHGINYGATNQTYDAPSRFSSANMSYQSYISNLSGHNTPVDPVPNRNHRARHSLDTISNPGFDPQSPDSSSTSRPTTQNSNDASGLAIMEGQIDKYNKLNKGDVGYGGNPFSRVINGNMGVAESLLSQRLRTLGVQGQANQEQQGGKQE
ncbi:hypothetical protein M426DRAFT_319743 [Hypoxylon sp. CI-4A]|nr:hypothetical protein M426DRAFT_319743 [Hypoxylon sp. CI-4A]